MTPKRGSVEEHSAGGVVLRFREGAPYVLIIRDPYKNWGLPKGHIEPGEDPVRTAMREVEEETGLQDVEVRDELGTIDWWFSKDGVRVHKFCTFFLMSSRSGEPRPEEAEGISACVWLPLGEAIERITYDNARAVMRLAAERLSKAEAGSPAGEENG